MYFLYTCITKHLELAVYLTIAFLNYLRRFIAHKTIYKTIVSDNHRQINFIGMQNK